MADRPDPPLNFPTYDLPRREQGGKAYVYDPIRRKYVRLTPEEWVRQHLVQYLVRDRGYPLPLVAVEMGFTYQGMTRRADVVVHDRTGRPVLMAECKAPEVGVGQATFDQVARYNQVVQARYLVVTNGLDHFCCALDQAAHSYRFLPDVPDFDTL